MPIAPQTVDSVSPVRLVRARLPVRRLPTDIRKHDRGSFYQLPVDLRRPPRRDDQEPLVLHPPADDVGQSHLCPDTPSDTSTAGTVADIALYTSASHLHIVLRLG